MRTSRSIWLQQNQCSCLIFQPDPSKNRENAKGLGKSKSFLFNPQKTIPNPVHETHLR